LVIAASMVAQGPPLEKYFRVKVTKIVSDPEIPIYTYILNSSVACTMNTRLDVKEGSEVKLSSEDHSHFIMDSDGKTYKCKFFDNIDGPPPIPQTEKK